MDHHPAMNYFQATTVLDKTSARPSWGRSRKEKRESATAQNISQDEAEPYKSSISKELTRAANGFWEIMQNTALSFEGSF